VGSDAVVKVFVGCLLDLLEAGFFFIMCDAAGAASGLLLMGGARIESSSVGRGVLCFGTVLAGNSGGTGGDDSDNKSDPPGIAEVVLFLLVGVRLLSPLEDRLSLFGRRSDESGVATAAAVFDMGRGVDSSSGRNSFSSSAVRWEESLVSIICRILGCLFRGFSVPRMDTSPAARSDMFPLGLTTLETRGAAAAGEEVGLGGDENIALGGTGASGDLRLDFAGLFNPDP
jgi:hypothetical protein